MKIYDIYKKGAIETLAYKDLIDDFYSEVYDFLNDDENALKLLEENDMSLDNFTNFTKEKFHKLESDEVIDLVNDIFSDMSLENEDWHILDYQYNEIEDNLNTDGSNLLLGFTSERNGKMRSFVGFQYDKKNSTEPKLIWFYDRNYGMENTDEAPQIDGVESDFFSYLDASSVKTGAFLLTSRSAHRRAEYLDEFSSEEFESLKIFLPTNKMLYWDGFKLQCGNYNKSEPFDEVPSKYTKDVLGTMSISNYAKLFIEVADKIDLKLDKKEINYLKTL